MENSLAKEDIAFLEFYRIPLSEEILDIGAKKFRASFVNNENLSEAAKNFREAFREVIEDIRKSLKLDDNPIMEKGELEEFAKYLADLIVQNKGSKTVKISRNRLAVKNNLDKLAWYVLVSNGGSVRFSSSFLGDDHLPGNLDDFRAQLRNKLSDIPFDNLSQYQFVVHKGFSAYEEILTLDEESFWKEIEKREVHAFNALEEKNNIKSLESFTNVFKGLIEEGKSKGEQIIKIKRKGVIGKNIDKLAGCVLVVEKDSTIKFDPNFISSDTLPGNLGDFKSKLNLNSNELGALRFHISKFPRDALPDKSISEVEDDVESFLHDLKFAVNQPNEVELAEMIKEELGEEFGVVNAKNVYSRFLEKTLDWMKERKGPAFSDQDAKDFFEEVKREIFGSVYFEVKDPVSLFTGREKELEGLHRMLQDNHGRVSLVTQIKSVSGLGGIGKTELVRKYVQEYVKDYDENVVWINAETETALAQSFFDLADDVRLGIRSTSRDKSAKNIKNLVKEIYNFFARKKSLFIFDNVNDAQSLKEFLPFSILRPSDKKPYVLITSRNQQLEDGIDSIELRGLLLKDAVTFVKKGLRIQDELQNKDIEDLVTELQFFPLAIQQAVSYIRYHSVTDKLSVVGYLAQYRERKKDCLDFGIFRGIDNEYTKTTFTTWDVTFHKIIGNKECGNLALEILYIMAYLGSENIDREMFLGLAEQDKEKLKSAVRLLVNYSIVNGQNEQSILGIHRLVQEVVMIRLADQHKSKEVMKRAVQLISNFGGNFGGFSRVQSVLLHGEMLLSHIDSWIAKNPQDQEVFCNPLTSLLTVLGEGNFEIDKLEVAAKCFKRVLEIEEVYGGKDIVKVVETTMDLGRVYESLEEYAEQERVLSQIEHDVRNIYEPKGPESLNLGEFLVELGRVRQRLENFDKENIKNLLEEGFSILDKVYPRGHDDRYELGEILVNLGEAYEALGDYRRQIESLDKALVIFSQCYGERSFEAARVQVDIARICVKLGRYREARERIDEAVLSPSLYCSDNYHVSKLLLDITQYHVGIDLDDDEIAAAADAERDSAVQSMLYQLEADSLAEAYALILMSRVSHGDGNLKFDYVEEAIGIFEKHYQEGSYELAKELINLADAYGDKDEPLEQEKVIQERVLPVLLREKSRDASYEIARAQLSLAKAYGGLGKYKEQLELLVETVLPFFVDKYGNDRLEVAEIQLTIAAAYGRFENNYTKQIDLIEEAVLPVLKPIFEECHQSSRIVDALVILGEAYGHLSNYEKKADCLQDALKFWRLFCSSLPTPPYKYDVSSAKIIVSLSGAYGALKQYEKQVDLLLEALGIFKENYTPIHKMIIKVRVLLAEAYRNLNQNDQATKVLNDSFPILDDERFHHIVSQGPDQVIEFLIRFYHGEGDSLQSSERGKRTMECSSPEHSLGKKARKERNTGMSCVDSLDDEFKNDEYKELAIKLFSDDNRMEKLENTKEFYDQLLEFSEQISKNERVDIGESLSTKIESIDLNLIDSEIRDIVREMQDNVRKKDVVKSILRRSGVAEKIGRVVEGANLAFTGFLVGKHIVNGNIEGLGYDALNLLIMPKIGEKISKKALELGEELDSQTLRVFSPVLGRAVGNFAAFLGVAESMKARKNAKDPVDKKIADLDIITNAAFIAGDVPVLIDEITPSLGIEVPESIGELAGPIGAAVPLIAVVMHDFIKAEFEVKKLEGQISLTSGEKSKFYWDFIFDGKFSQNISNDLKAKQVYEQYIKHYMQKFANIYDRVAIPLPSIMIEKEVKYYCYAGYCGSNTYSVNVGLIDNGTALFGHECFDKYNWSRVIPTVENYTITCGPVDEDIEVETSRKEGSWSHYEGANHVERVKEVFSFKKYPLQCDNSIVYKRTNSSTYDRSMYYIQRQVAKVYLSYNDAIDFVFHGSNVSVTSDKEANSSAESRYYFSQILEDCVVHKPGINFFHVAKIRFSCDLRGNKQKNIILTRGNFTDLHTGQADSIIGSIKTNYIEVSNANYVDGKGGNDVVTVKNFAIIKGYFGDSISGKGLVLLSINFNDIASMAFAGSVNNIYHKNGAAISIDRLALVKTADGFFVTPTKVDTNTGRVTNVKITKSVDGNIILYDELIGLQKIGSSSFDVVKQLSSDNYHITICGLGSCIFYPDKDSHSFYWGAEGNMSHLYLFDQKNANITIANANGILDFTQLNSTLDSIELEQDSEGRIRFSKNSLNLVLLPSYKDVTFTSNGEEYYKLQEGELERDYCSHDLKIDGRFSVNGTDLPRHYNCFTFNSDKVLFLRLNDSLVLLSGNGSLSILNYYSSVQKNWDLSVKLNGRMLKPKEFRARADNFSSFRYYRPDGGGLKIYHNQPGNTHSIGLVDLRDKSILDLDVRIVGDNLLLLHENNTLVRVENLKNYQPSRKMIFAFNDTVLYNSKCIVSNCSPEYVVMEFNEAKRALLAMQKPGPVRQSNLDKKEKPLQRKRRHHGHSLGKSPAIDSSNQPGMASSSGVRMSSWISDLVVWVKSSVSRLLAYRAALPEVSANYSNTAKNPDSQYTRQFSSEVCISNNVGLGFLLIQSFLDKKYPLPKFCSVTPEEALASTLNITKKFEQILRKIAKQSNISVKDVDFFKIYLDIADHVRNERYSKIPNTLYSVAKEVCPKNEKFLSILKGNIEKMFDEQQIVNSGYQVQTPNCIADNKPRSYLSNTTVDKHLQSKYHAISS